MVDDTSYDEEEAGQDEAYVHRMGLNSVHESSIAHCILYEIQ